MTKTEQNDRCQLYRNLEALGIDYDTAQTLRRISMTLHRWFELECGDSNDHGSWVITRGRKERRDGQHSKGHGPHHVFVHDDDGKPFMEQHPRSGNDVHYSALPDRETGARKRLAKIMAAHPDLLAYVQTDPRGNALYILRKTDLRDGEQLDSVYTKGLAIS